MLVTFQESAFFFEEVCIPYFLLVQSLVKYAQDIFRSPQPLPQSLIFLLNSLQPFLCTLNLSTSQVQTIISCCTICFLGRKEPKKPTTKKHLFLGAQKNNGNEPAIANYPLQQLANNDTVWLSKGENVSSAEKTTTLFSKLKLLFKVKLQIQATLSLNPSFLHISGERNQIVSMYKRSLKWGRDKQVNSNLLKINTCSSTGSSLV